MSAVSQTLDSLLANAARRGRGSAIPPGSDRLWGALSRPFHRELPAKGFDVLGERVKGFVARRRGASADRRRTARIMSRAAELALLGDAGWDRALESARAGVARSRDDRGAVDEGLAVAYEAVRREIGLSLYVEQVMGALAMVDGCCAEMATGEGKTATAVLPAAIDGWGGRGVHVVTVNDYLARRDAEITGPAYRRLGLSVGVIQDGSTPAERKRAYACSVTYGSDKQFIFDHLRDRLLSPLAPRLAGHLLDQIAQDGVVAPAGEGGHEGGEGGWSRRVVQRGLHAAIVDEADSVLIDEAVTPAIIGEDVPSDGADGRADYYKTAAAIAAELVPGEDYSADQRLRRVRLTGTGRDKLAARAGALPPFWSGPRRREELVVQAIGAREIYLRGDDYIVRDEKIVIVDRSTGRLLEGRQWQLGVHQAVEAKEGVEITDDRRTSARTSYQRFFQRYRRLSGMTGTAWEVRTELWGAYRLPVVRVPTHRPVIRTRAGDRVFMNEAEKFEAVAARVAELHARRQPVLVGTRSVASSELLGALLEERGVECRILNAVREAEEAAIVARAGEVGAVTVATNMAGRGTDIILAPGARERGGLAVVATEHHDEARVDRQLYGRSGRQGDPGRAEAFVSLDEALIVRHGLGWLALLCRLARGPVRRALAAALWAGAQRSAGKRTAMLRGEVTKSDAWYELSMHHHSR